MIPEVDADDVAVLSAILKKYWMMSASLQHVEKIWLA